MTGYESKKAMARDKLDSMEREALKLALKVLQFNGNIWHMDCKKDEAITAIKEALAQPAQEPVVTIAVREHAPVGKVAYVLEVNLPVGIHNLYTTPPQRTWVGLTKDDTFEIAERLGLADVAWLDLMVAIEAKLKEKNNG